MPRQSLPQQEPIGLLISAVRRRIKQAVGAGVRQHRLTPQQFWVLVAALEEEGQSLGELGARLRMDQPTASRVVRALSDRGLLISAEDPEDRRRSVLRLTASGEKLAREVRSLAEEVRGAVDQALEPAEREQVRAALKKIIATIDRVEERVFARAAKGAARSSRLNTR